MKLLEHRIPPPLIGLLCALLAWALTRAWPAARLDFALRLPLAVLCLLAGAALDGWSLWNFRRQRTTVNPLAPARAGSLVIAGPYRFTRNPMYLGMALILLAWCLWLGSAAALLALAAFVGYITRFQIVPEERALAGRFGAAYEDYRRRVRRWV